MEDRGIEVVEGFGDLELPEEMEKLPNPDMGFDGPLDEETIFFGGLASCLCTVVKSTRGRDDVDEGSGGLDAEDPVAESKAADDRSGTNGSVVWRVALAVPGGDRDDFAGTDDELDLAEDASRWRCASHAGDTPPSPPRT